MRRTRCLTLAGWICLLITSLPAAAEPVSQAQATRCIINAVAQSCQVVQTTDSLELSLDNGRAITSCNVKITLPNDTAYGLLVRSATEGTTLTWPQLRIEMPELIP